MCDSQPSEQMMRSAFALDMATIDPPVSDPRV